VDIIVADYPGEQRVALLDDGSLREYYIHRPAAPDGVGDVHVGRVIALVPAMAGAFVALADAEAFLPDTDGARGLSAGDHIAVRITRAPQGGKGPRVAWHPAPGAQDGPARLLHRGPTPLEELRAAFPQARVDAGGFDDALLAEIDALAGPAFDLPGCMRATAVPTPALTAIDLDGGGATAARAIKAAAQYAANAAALPELARQIRLRNFGGAILVDFAGMAAKRRAALAAPLEAALAPDRLHPRVAGFTMLGFAEILRPRLRPPLHEKLAGPLAAGLAALRLAVRHAQAEPARRWALRAAPAVITALQADSAALGDLARRTTHPLMLRSDPAMPGTTTSVEPADA
jgi:hypothetical protein